ncbi:MAG: TonB-dependent receptor, partial [Acidobacteriia bacterium]|nr:TonB-dependent receptor [Terriglobia bacterium]
MSAATNDSYTVQPNASLAMGRHIMKFGAEGRRYNDNSNNPGFASGNYTFGRNWTQARALQADAVSGNEVATFLLGYPTSGVVDRNIDPSVRTHYFAAFFQDDFKVSQRLTINIGLRWDYEMPGTERFDRALRGMDFNAPSPIANRVQGLNLRGAIQFAGRDGQPRGAFLPDRNNWQPRIGAAYRIGTKWVVRGGYGLYYLGQNEIGAQQGFSQPTSGIASTDGGLRPAVSLSNPFTNQAGGRLLDAIGASQGAASFLGQGVTVNYLNRPLPYSQQYSFDIERELPGNMVAEVAYVGNLTRNLPLNAPLNVVPANQLGRLNAAGQIDTAYYTERISNPMAGLIPN